jgi:dTDP-4-dehydrorhamnose 3,5-epimerase-like enzyme
VRDLYSGSTPASQAGSTSPILVSRSIATLAQLVEQCFRKAEVSGSIPEGGSTQKCLDMFEAFLLYIVDKKTFLPYSSLAHSFLSKEAIMEILCEPLSPANESSPKGLRTFEWRLPEDRQITVYMRKAGEVAGSHFHKGEVPSKNPELFLLLSGRAMFDFVAVDGKQTSQGLDAAYGPVRIVIPPYTLHRLTPVTDITFIEFLSVSFDPKNTDTYPPRDFPVQTDWKNP